VGGCAKKRVESMIRLMLIAALLHLSVVAADAQKLYAIAFAEIDHATWQATEWSKQRFLSLSEEVASEFGYEREGIERIGKACSKSALKKTIKNLACSAGDIVMFAYFGHGVRAAGDRSRFPQMVLSSNKERDFVPLEDVKDALLAKGVRFVFVMGDCGNSVSRDVSPKRGILKARRKSVANGGKAGNVNTQNLFGARGSVIVSASSPRECAWVKDRSVFSDELFSNLGNVGPEATWSDVLSTVKGDVCRMTGTIMQVENQNPVYTIDIH